MKMSDKLEISASLIKELREKTGVGIMDCKMALTILKRLLTT